MAGTPLATAFVRLRPDVNRGEFRRETGRAVQGANLGAAGRREGGKFGRGFAGGMRGTLAAVGTAFAAIGGIEVFKSFIDGAEESARIGRITAAVIRSTGGAAHITARHVQALGDAIMRQTAVDDETVKSGENMLLTFRSIRNETGRGNDIFDQATRALTDMVAAMNGGEVTSEGMRAGAIRLGKALNDPVRGMTALRRVGVQFTEQQQKQIKELVKSGNVLGAQKVILRELGKEFGGTAAAAASPMKRLRTMMGEVAENIGGYLLPAVDAFSSWVLKTGIPSVQRFAGWAGGMIPVARIRRDIGAVTKTLGDFLGGLAGTGGKPLVTVLPTGRKIAEAGGGPVSAARKLGLQLRFAITSGFRDIDWGGVIGNALRAAVSAAPKIGAAFMSLLGRVNWLEAGKKAAFALVPLAIGLVNNLVTALISEAVHHPMDMVMFLASVIPVGRAAGILAKLFGRIPLLGRLIVWLARPLEAAGGFMERALGRVLRIVFGPLAKRIGGFFAGARGWLRGKGEAVILGLWYGAEAVMRRLLGWARRIGGWVAAQLARPGRWLVGKGMSAIGGLWDGARWVFRRLLGWAGAIGGWVAGRLVRPGRWLVGKGMSVIGGLWDGARWAWRLLAAWLSGSAARVSRWFGGARRWLVAAGKNILYGLGDGLYAAARGIWRWVRQIGSWIVNGIKAFFHMKSPAGLMVPIGANILRGVIRGMFLSARSFPAVIRTIFGSMPAALGHVISRGLISVASLPARALGMLSKAGGWLAGLLGFGGGGGAPSANVALGKRMAAAMGWVGAQWQALYRLWLGESGWRKNARNRESGAFGIPQALPASKMASAGRDWMTNAATQIRWGLRYILSVYGDPLTAFAMWMRRSPHWYGRGGWVTEPVIGIGTRSGRGYGFGESGPEYVSRRGGGGPLVQIGNFNAVERADVELLARRLAFSLEIP